MWHILLCMSAFEIVDLDATDTLRVGATITIGHLAWGILTGTVKTLHKNGKSGTLSVEGHASPIAFRVSQILA